MAQQSIETSDNESKSNDAVLVLRKLNETVQNNVQCHHGTILDQLSQIHILIWSYDDEDIENQCDILLDAGAIKIIVKLLDSANNDLIIHCCFQLAQTLTCYARKSHYVTNEHVSAPFFFSCN